MNCPDFRKSIEITDSRRPPRVVTIAPRPMATIDSRKCHVNIQGDVEHDRFSNGYFG